MSLQRGEIETELVRFGHLVAGVDEVGRGCLAGPVCTGAMILDLVKLESLTPGERDLIRDSKQLTPEQRRTALPIIQRISLASALGWASVSEIETLGLQEAIYTAMARALRGLSPQPTFVLVDGKLTIGTLKVPQRSVVKGDDLCFCIAAAAILAKEARDDHMREMSLVFHGYGFEEHVGYGTKAHLNAINTLGLCELHRRNFAPIRAMAAEPSHSKTFFQTP